MSVTEHRALQKTQLSPENVVSSQVSNKSMYFRRYLLIQVSDLVRNLRF